MTRDPIEVEGQLDLLDEIPPQNREDTSGKSVEADVQGKERDSW